MTAWGTPPTFSVGEKPTAAKLQTLSDDLNFSPHVSLRATASQTISNATWTAVAFTVEDHDSDAMHDNSTNNTRATFVTAGSYAIGACAAFKAATNAVALGARVFYNGASPLGTILVPGCGQDGNGPTLVAQYTFVAATYVELQVFQNSGSNLDTVGGTEGITLTLHRVGV